MAAPGIRVLEAHLLPSRNIRLRGGAKWGMVFLFSFLSLTPLAFPGEKHNLTGPLLAKEIQTLENQLRDLEGRSDSLTGRIEILRRREALAARQVRQLEINTQATQKKLLQTRTQVKEAQRDIAIRLAWIQKRLRAHYRAGRLRQFRAYLEVEKAQELLRLMRYLSAMEEVDRRALSELKIKRVELKSLEQQENEEATKMEGLLEDTKRRKALLSKRRKELKAELWATEHDQAEHQKLLAERMNAAGKLAKVTQDISLSQHLSLLSKDIHRQRGSISWPIKGKKSLGFGDRIHPRFHTTIPHPGWDVTRRSKSTVRAIWDGEVVFAAFMPGLGYTVILDHLHGVMSVYAHLGDVGVKKGQVIRRRRPMGHTGPLNSGQQGVYFELRVGGIPVNPSLWLKENP